MTRTGLAALAVLIATLLVPAAVTASWLSLRVDDTEAYVETVEPLADDPVLREELGDRVAQAALGRLQDAAPVGLPDSLDGMVRAATETVVESPDFPDFWGHANADAHREFLAVVHERGDGSTGDGWVFVDLRPLVDQVLRTLAAEHGIPEHLAPELRVPVVPEARLAEARGGYRALEGLATWLPLGWGALVVLALLLARGARGRLRTAAAAAAGAALGAGLVLATTPVGVDLAVDQAGAEQRDLVRLVVEVVVATLDDAARSVAIGAGAAAVGLLLASVLVGRDRREADSFHP